MVMEHHSRDLAAHIPFMSSVMTVCSERHREFWIRAGTDPDRDIVTGQPRFDVYFDPPEHPSDRTLLYLSYDDVAYLPSDRGEEFAADWRTPRRETEEALAEAARDWTVIEKRHPQQVASTSWLGSRVSRASQSADTRRLILDAAIVVGIPDNGPVRGVGGRPIGGLSCVGIDVPGVHGDADPIPRAP